MCEEEMCLFLLIDSKIKGIFVHSVIQVYTIT